MKPDSVGSCLTHSTRHAPQDADEPVTHSKQRVGPDSQQTAFLSAIGCTNNSPTARRQPADHVPPLRPRGSASAPVSDVHRCAEPCGGDPQVLTFQYSFPP